MKKNFLFEISNEDWKGSVGDEYRKIEPEILKKYRVDKSNKLSDIENSFQFNRDLQRQRKNWWSQNADHEFFNSTKNENIVTLHGISSYGGSKYKTFKELKKDYDIFYNPTKIIKNEQSVIGIIVNKDPTIQFTPAMAFQKLIDDNIIGYGLGDVLLHFWTRRITVASLADNWSETFNLYRSFGKKPQTTGDWYKKNPDILNDIKSLKQQIQSIENDNSLKAQDKDALLQDLNTRLKELIRSQAHQRQQNFDYFDLTKSSGTRKNPISYLNSNLLQNDSEQMDKFGQGGVSAEAIGDVRTQSVLKPSELRRRQDRFGEMIVGNAKIKDVFTQTDYEIYENFIRETTHNGIIDDTIPRDKNSELFDSLMKLKFFSDYGVPCFDSKGDQLNVLLDFFTFKSVSKLDNITEMHIKKLIRRQLLKRI